MTNKPNHVDATARNASVRVAKTRQSAAQNELRTIDGEVVTVAQIRARTGLTTKQVRDRYRKGLRTWAALKSNKRPA